MNTPDHDVYRYLPNTMATLDEWERRSMAATEELRRKQAVERAEYLLRVAAEKAEAAEERAQQRAAAEDPSTMFLVYVIRAAMVAALVIGAVRDIKRVIMWVT